MCGIAGKVYFDRAKTVSLSAIASMSDSIVHRGPDDYGSYIDNNVGLGFRRLSIIDLHDGHQPLSNQDQSVWITFNGEIYNFQELRTDLEKKGHKFRTKSDTEVILVLYLEYGQKCLSYLRGMFAFVIYDKRKKTLFGARDRFGIKPFYYALNDKQFSWGSEIKVLFATEGIEKKIHYPALDDYLTYGYILGDKSIFEGVKKLEPGHSFNLDIESGSFKTKKYWDIHFQPDYSVSEKEWEERVLEMLTESVRLHMIADVPLGAFLSGGIDSSTVVALMAKLSDQQVKTFSIGFKEAKFNELDHARRLAEMYQTDHHEMIVEPDSVGLISTLVNSFDEPFADSSAIPTYYVSKFTREHVTVALSGDGGDEVFAGYSRYAKMNRLYSRPFNHAVINKAVFGTMHKMMPNSMAGKGLAYYLSLNPNQLGAYMGIFKPQERQELYTSQLKSQLNGREAEDHMLQTMSSIKADFTSKLQGNDMKNYMVDDILTKVDRVSMANSLEVRVPLLDHKLFELSAKIPSKYKLNNGGLKMILKNIMEPYFPTETINHPKQGFGVPLSVWFKDDLKEYVNDTLLADSAKIGGYVKQVGLQKIIDGHNNGGRDFSGKIWSMMFLEEWLNKNF